MSSREFDAPVPASSPPVAPERVVLDPEGIRRAVTRIGHEILERNSDPGSLMLVAIAEGGVPIGEMLAERLRIDSGREVPLGVLDVTLYRDDVIVERKRPLPHRTRMAESVTGRRVVLVEDVVFTGRTVRAAMDAVIDFGRPEAIQVATLVDRGHRELPIRVDYVGKNLPTARAERVVLRPRPDGPLEVVVAV
ncbi:MAG: bifunctional pyr operon transcriptional regulator/uracil phosphoribosyltransferase PyrR [Myxococcota bacterium]